MYINAVIGNRNHPERGTATIQFPVETGDYEHDLDLLDTLGIGHVLKTDCFLQEIESNVPALKRLEGTEVNFDELDFLAKRLDSFDKYEIAQFQAATVTLYGNRIADLINLTYCCQQATVITDFSDLEAIGRRHYIAVNGGAGPRELATLDGRETALQLIGSGAGVVTPYGVLYSNGMKLEQVYRGGSFPDYDDGSSLLTIEVWQDGQSQESAFLYLPATGLQIERTLWRAGTDAERGYSFRVVDDRLPDAVRGVLDFENESIAGLNDMCLELIGPNGDQVEMLSAAIKLADASTAEEIRTLAFNLDLFDFIPGVKTPEALGKYMIRESGRYEYDPDLASFYNYERYGAERIAEENGQFTDRGYIAYKGEAPLEDLLGRGAAEQTENQGMGGIS